MVTSLQNLNREINRCIRCPLYKTATHAVPGEGDPNAKIMFVGEAPGRVEDETGKPFVGRAGRLLDKLFESIGIERKSVFITSVVKHRPPKNRQPKPSEVKACVHWLNLQLEIIKPKLIVTLGRFGLEYFLPKHKISLIHGTIQVTTLKRPPGRSPFGHLPGELRSYRIYPVYHPAAALRSTRNKQTLEKDFKKLREIVKDLN